MSEIALRIVIGLNRTVNSINKKTAQLCLKHKLTLSQFGVLEALYHKGDMTIGEVKDRILSSDGTIPVVVKNLEKNEWIERRAHPRDKRCTILHLTDKGKTLIKEVFPQNEKLIEEQMAVLDDQEKITLLALLKKLKDQ